MLSTQKSCAIGRLSVMPFEHEQQEAQRQQAEEVDLSRLASIANNLKPIAAPDEGELEPCEPSDKEKFDHDDAGLEGSIATRPTSDPEDLGYPTPLKEIPQPISISLNEA
jgi:hypothetical protein